MRDRLALTVEDFVVALIYWIGGIPRRVGEAFAEVGQLLVRSFDGAPGGQQAFENEVAEYIAPHMPVLIHKRTRMYVATDEGAVERWSLELRCFLDRSLLPIMGVDREYAERNRGLVAELVDRVIAREQIKATERGRDELLPRVTRFESSWVV